MTLPAVLCEKVEFLYFLRFLGPAFHFEQSGRLLHGRAVITNTKDNVCSLAGPPDTSYVCPRPQFSCFFN
jgi:hypothetical protein